MFEGTDNSAGEEQVSQVIETSTEVEVDADTTEAPDLSTDPATQTEEAQAAGPFASGKEKFVIDGEEHEWTWEETKKYAQLGKAGYKRMQEAATIKKQVADNYKKLTQLAHTNPQGLLEILTGKKAEAGLSPQADVAPRQSETRGLDPRDAEIQELKQRIEARELAEERKQIDTELSDAVSKHPELNNQIYREYVKSQYAKALRQGMEDVTIADIAFMVSQELKQQQAAQLKAKQQKIKERRDRAPVAVSPGYKAEKSESLDLEAVKRLAGRM
jgi:hypothetical protein